APAFFGHTGPVRMEIDATGGMPWLTSRLQAVGRGIALGGFAVAGSAVSGLLILAVLSNISWIGSFTFPALCLVCISARSLARRRRALAMRWSNRDIPSPYFQKPELQKVAHGWYWTGHDYHKYNWVAWWSLNATWVGRDPGTWRDVLWLICEPV